MSRWSTAVIVTSLFVGCGTLARHAEAQTFTGTYVSTNGHTNTASATFSLVTGTQSYLDLALTDTSTFSKYNNTDLLSGFFFDIAENPTLNMANSSATTPNTLFNASSCSSSAICSTSSTSPSVNLGYEWRYLYSATGFNSTLTPSTFATTARYGVASSQYGGLSPSFGTASPIGTNPTNLGGSGAQLAFALVGGNYNSGTSSNSLSSLPLTDQTINFQFALPSGVTSLKISKVSFTYGTNPDGSTSAPEPSSLAVFAAGCVALGLTRRKQGRARLEEMPL